MTVNIDIPPFSKIIANPVVRSIVTNALGAMAAALDNSLQNPGAGAAAYFNVHPEAALTYILVQDVAHNLIGSFLTKVNGQTNTSPIEPSSVVTEPTASTPVK
jgi:hypothetical protein